MKKLFFYTLIFILYWESIKAIFRYIRTAPVLGVGTVWLCLLGVLVATAIAITAAIVNAHGRLRIQRVNEDE